MLLVPLSLVSASQAGGSLSGRHFLPGTPQTLAIAIAKSKCCHYYWAGSVIIVVVVVVVVVAAGAGACFMASNFTQVCVFVCLSID